MFKKLKFKWQFLLFTGIAALFCIIALLTNIFDHPTFSNSLLFFDRSDTFMDFFNTLFDSTQPRPYDKGTIYPAFCYLIYELMASFVSPSELSYGGFSIRISQEGMMIFAVYTAITCTALFMLLFSQTLFCCIYNMIRSVHLNATIQLWTTAGTMTISWFGGKILPLMAILQPRIPFLCLSTEMEAHIMCSNRYFRRILST